MTRTTSPIEIRAANGQWRWYSSVAEAAERTNTNRRTMSSRVARGVEGYRYAGDTPETIEARRRRHAVVKAKGLERARRKAEARDSAGPGYKALARELGCRVQDVYRVGEIRA